MHNRRTIRDFLLAIASIALVIFVPLVFSRYVWRSTFFYDDAYMFYRYAYNLHHFHAVVWNQNGPHTYGTTSLPWMLVITAFSYLPLNPIILLPLASSLFFIASIPLIAYVISRTARSPVFQNFWQVFLILTLSLVLSIPFLYSVTNGMETMLSFFMNACVCLLSWRLMREECSYKWILLVAGAAFVAYLVRPESGICDLLTPALAIFFSGRKNKYSNIFSFWSVALSLIVAQLLACRLYFGTALPLSFYIKSEGILRISDQYIPAWPLYLYAIFGLIAIPLVIIALTCQRKQWHLLFAFLMPAFLTFLYLGHVVQFTGDYGRYYAPFLPYFIVSSIHVVDAHLDNRIPIATSQFIPRVMIALVFMAMASQSYGGAIWKEWANRGFRGSGPEDIHSFVPIYVPLPSMTWKAGILAFSNDVACALPPGTKVAASEVGDLSGECLQISILDLSGLNDTTIARNGFSASYVLHKKPDLIWLPNNCFTLWRRKILLDTQFQKQYELIADSFNFGIAIRKDSPHYAAILAVLRRAWPKYYPNTCVAPICEAQPTPSLP